MKWAGSGGGKKDERKDERWLDESSCEESGWTSGCGEGWRDDPAEAASRWGEWRADECAEG